jgi:lipopolysaccharide export system protein LptA
VKLTLPLAALALAAALLAQAPPAARAQNFGLGLSGNSDNNKPIDIEADNGIEWQQNNRVYIARGNAKATRGQTTVFGDTLMAFYRPVCGPQPTQGAAKGAPGPKRASAKPVPAAAPAAPPPAAKRPDAGQTEAAQTNCPDTGAAQKSAPDAKQASDGPIGGSSTEIYRLEADGHVRIATETQTIYGDHAVYDVDKSLLIVTGKHLKLETPRDTLTARDDFEWYDDKQLAVARGDAVDVRDGKRIAGDVLTAEMEKDAKGASHITRIDALGNVLVSSLDQIARGDAGVYNLDTGIATLTGRVTLTRGDNELRGRYGVVDLNNNVSRLLSAPPSATLTEGHHERVAGLLVPRPKPTPPEKPAKPAEPAAQ